MRPLAVLLPLVISTPVLAETRIGVHVGGGLEAGTIQGEPRPDGVAEAGIGLDHYVGRWGGGVVLESVGRKTNEVPIAEELKLDFVVRYRFAEPATRRATLGFGAGLRWLTTEGDLDRPPSSIRGIDMLRMETEAELVSGQGFSLDFYFAWTIGYYSGEMFLERFGDMPYPTRDVSTLVNSYVLGLKTSYSM